MKNKINEIKLRSFGFLIGIGFPIFIGFIIPLITGHVFRFWTLWVGGIFLLFAIFRPYSLNKTYKIWMKFGSILGWLNSRIILSFIFIFVLQPISFFMRVFGYDPLKINKLSLKTYKENTSNRKIDLTRTF